MSTRLLFVCPKGHVFRSLAKMKPGRYRLCSVCNRATPNTRGCKTIDDARTMVEETAPHKTFVHVFTNGTIKTKRKSPSSH